MTRVEAIKRLRKGNKITHEKLPSKFLQMKQLEITTNRGDAFGLEFVINEEFNDGWKLYKKLI